MRGGWSERPLVRHQGYPTRDISPILHILLLRRSIDEFNGFATTANSSNWNALIERGQFPTCVNGQSQRELGDWAIRQLGNWGDRAIGHPRSENGECGCELYGVAESPVLRGRGVFASVGSW